MPPTLIEILKDFRYQNVCENETCGVRLSGGRGTTVEHANMFWRGAVERFLKEKKRQEQIALVVAASARTAGSIDRLERVLASLRSTLSAQQCEIARQRELLRIGMKGVTA